MGTSGFAYREWRPAFYPAGLPESRFLEFYGRTLTACEINATFYRLQAPATMAGWAAAVPPDFRFAVKAHRDLTHGRSWPPGAGDPAGLLDRFLDSLAALGDRLGAVLFQFPPSRRRDDEGLEALLAALPAGTPAVLEFRHASWSDPEVAVRVAAAGATICHSDTSGDVPDGLPPGPRAYVRLRADRYSPEAREGWWRLLQGEARRRDVLVFAKHEGVPADDELTGVGLARWIRHRAG